MLRIAVCDDDLKFTGDFETLVLQESRNMGIRVETDVFSDGDTLVKSILSGERYNLIFLDIEMNSTSGLDIAHALPPESCLIFTTAHAQYALNGFELDAVDFLHKPFAYERFEKAVEKALRFIEAKRNKVPENIIIKQEYNNISVTTSDILYIEAMENYTKIFRTSGNYILSRTSLKAIQKMLPKDRFLRTHRSYIVSINKIERFSKREITLKGCSATIPIGRQYAENVYSKLTTRSITT